MSTGSDGWYKRAYARSVPDMIPCTMPVPDMAQVDSTLRNGSTGHGVGKPHQTLWHYRTLRRQTGPRGMRVADIA
eukprot:413968-Rhodomonas_salina.4